METDWSRSVVQKLSSRSSMSAEELLPLVYDELRRLAEFRLRRLGSGQTLQGTAIVHEAWLKLVAQGDPGWEGRAHFFGAAARAMRNLLVDDARRKSTLKHGAGKKFSAGFRIQEECRVEHEEPDYLELDLALSKLERRDPMKARVVMLRFFTGLTMEEVSAAIGCSLTQVEREWRFARAWLQDELASAA